VTERLPGLKFLLFALVCAVAAAWIVSVTGNIRWVPFVTPTEGYEAELRNATGLRVGDDVRLAGVPVGRVQEIELEQGTPVVTFSLRDHVEPTDTWEVGPQWRNVTGQRYLYLYATGDGQPLEPGGRIPVERSRTAANIDRFLSEITPLLRAIDPEQQNELLAALNTALIGREQRVQELVSDLGSLSREVADTRPQLETVLREGNRLLAEYNRREEELGALIDDLSSVSSTLRTRNDELLGAIRDIAEVQRRFGDFLRADDAHLRGLIDDAEVVVGSIGDQLGDFEGAIELSAEGFSTYMLISRWGEWFNVRTVAVMAAQGNDVLYCQTEGGTTCNPPNLAGSEQAYDVGDVAARSLGERRGARWGSALDAAASSLPGGGR
jgi:phospholipid/cholesterol/gamma-HCH transport system substrate-binding protein